MKDNKDNNQEESFESMLEKSFTQINTFKPGQLVETTVVSITNGCVFLQLGGKSEGQLDADELTDAEGNVTVEPGETIKAFFLKRDQGSLIFTTKISGEKAGNQMLQNAFENSIPVDGTVNKEIKGGFEISLGDSRAFCPFSQMGLSRVEDASSYIGKSITFKIIEYGENGRNILVSNKAILEEEREQKIEELKTSLSEGMVIRGNVVKIQDFGAFVDIGGVQALLPVSEVSRSRTENIRSEFEIGQEIEAKIISLEWQRQRITLSLKALQPDPWQEAAKKYPEGSIHTGTVAKIAKFGAFVSLEPGIDGLIHISELRTDTREYGEDEIAEPGRKLSVQVLSIDVKNQRIALGHAPDKEAAALAKQYLEPEEDSYNPFADLLKKRGK